MQDRNKTKFKLLLKRQKNRPKKLQNNNNKTETSFKAEEKTKN